MKTKRTNWFKLAFQLRGSVILVIYQRVIGFGLFSFIVSVLYYFKLPVSQPILGSIIPSIVLGLLLVFRTNTAYERFWEGRRLWGNLVNDARNMAWQIGVMMNDIEAEDRAKRIAVMRLVAALLVACKLYLRSEPVNSELEELMSRSQYLQLKTINNPPLQIVSWIADYLQLKKILEKIRAKIPVKYQEFQPKLLEQRWFKILTEIPGKAIDTFWISPAWLVATVSAVIFTIFFVSIDENSVLGQALGAADTISLVVALVLVIKEAPDRRKQFHYQAWGIIDAAHGVKVSYARILALQDLNEDNVSLRGLDAPGAELVDINLPKANLSAANLSESDLSNANLSNINLDNANLSGAKLSGANLSHANLSFARLSQANLSSANLSSANLICADLSNANMSGANLKNATLSGANLEGTYLTGANLKGAQVSISELSAAFIEGAIMPDGSKHKSLKDSK